MEQHIQKLTAFLPEGRISEKEACEKLLMGLIDAGSDQWPRALDVMETSVRAALKSYCSDPALDVKWVARAFLPPSDPDEEGLAAMEAQLISTVRDLNLLL